MWECGYCRVTIKDKYKFCWNCARPRAAAEQVNEPDRVAQVETTEVLAPVEPPVVPPPIETPVVPPPVETPQVTPPIEAAVENVPSEPEKIVHDEPVVRPIPSRLDYDDPFLAGFGSGEEVRPPSKILQLVPFAIWLIAIAAVGTFTYLSSQKMAAFGQKIETERQFFSSQKSQYVFPGKPTMRRGTTIEFTQFRPKVLPLNARSGEVEPLFSVLPDDLRPTSAEEVKSLMWFDCRNTEVGRYTDGTAGFQENCTIYLIDRETSKYIAIQDFIGVMPALSKERGGGDAVGRVPSERYIAFLREKQPDSERSPMETAPDSPAHHYFSKSEFIYALLLLGVLTAVGLGWVAYKIKYNWDAD